MNIYARRFSFVVAIVLVLSSSLFAAGGQLEAELKEGRLDVKVDGKLFTSYKFDSSQKYPYFWPVIGPASGKSVTTETTEPYPHHHSLFFGCDRVNGGNYWQESNERGQILSQGPKVVQAQGDKVVFVDRCLWKQPGKDAIIRDERMVTIQAPDDDLRILDFAIRLTSLTDIRIQKTNHALFSARMVPELSVKSGGTLINAEGKKSEKGTFAAKSGWCDYFGSRGGVVEGLAIFGHPSNRWYPCEWFTRDYGFFSPTPMYWLEGGLFKMPESQVLSLQYRVIVHAGDVQKAQIGKLFKSYAKTPAAVKSKRKKQ